MIIWYIWYNQPACYICITYNYLGAYIDWIRQSWRYFEKMWLNMNDWITMWWMPKTANARRTTPWYFSQLTTAWQSLAIGDWQLAIGNDALRLWKKRANSSCLLALWPFSSCSQNVTNNLVNAWPWAMRLHHVVPVNKSNGSREGIGKTLKKKWTKVHSAGQKGRLKYTFAPQKWHRTSFLPTRGSNMCIAAQSVDASLSHFLFGN